MNNTKTRIFRGLRRLPGGVAHQEMIYYFEPRRCRSVFSIGKETIVSASFPPMLIGTCRLLLDSRSSQWSPPIVFVASAEQTDEPFDMRTTPLCLISGGLCVGDEARVMLAEGKITAPEAVWMTAWGPGNIRYLSDFDTRIKKTQHYFPNDVESWTEL